MRIRIYTGRVCSAYTPTEARIRYEAMRRYNPNSTIVVLSSAELAAFRTRMLELECSALTENEKKAYCSMPQVYPIESLAFHTLVNYETGEIFDPYYTINKER